ncbi:DNA methylase family protein (plasmid) [Clostridium sporogenes]|nr:DNA methylase family protein [Clostridium sporogenes]
MLEINDIYNMDCLLGLKLLDDNSIDCCVTSPPYYGLRDYGEDKQIGLEETPEEYVQKLVEVFREVRRVLKQEGTLWLNLGDSFWNRRSMNGQGWHGKLEKRKGYMLRSGGKNHEYLKPKDLI